MCLPGRHRSKLRLQLRFRSPFLSAGEYLLLRPSVPLVRPTDLLGVLLGFSCMLRILELGGAGGAVGARSVELLARLRV